MVSRKEKTVIIKSDDSAGDNSISFGRNMVSLTEEELVEYTSPAFGHSSLFRAEAYGVQHQDQHTH
eukprot:13267590-Ditylum_brightwellii.AAC.1